MSAIPVKIIDTMHELEHEYKSLTNVPRKDTRLIKLNRFFNNDEDAKDDKIKSLIIDGYSVREIEDMVKTSHERVSKVAIQYHIPIRQKFNYVAVKKIVHEFSVLVWLASKWLLKAIQAILRMQSKL